MLIFELGLVLALTLLNGLLAMSELAVVSARPARLKGMAERGVRGARIALALASDPGRFLSSVQIGITLVGILSGAFSGATLGDRLSAAFLDMGLPVTWAYVLGVGIVVSGITYLSLILGELVPKQLALKNPEGIACRVAPLMLGIAQVASPIVWLLDKSGKLVLALMGARAESDQKVTEEEIRTIVAEAEQAGILEPGEREMIAGVMRLGDRPVRSVMTHRLEVDMVDLSKELDSIFRLIADSPHSRFPVHEGDREEIIGVLWSKDLFDHTRIAGSMDLRALVRPAPVVLDSMDALDVVDQLKRSPMHIGLVHDEYGNFQGVVSAADILEAIVGVFATEEGGVEPPIVPREDGSLLIEGWMPVEEFADRLDLVLPDDRSYETVAGFLIDSFGRLPGVGDHVRIQQWRFEVVDLDGRRIDKVLASHAPASVRDERALSPR